jgi:dTDP-4-dehydrorhamnose 3,5-epimerase
MKIIETSIPEVKVFVPNVFRDDRGFFLESFNQNNFSETFVQDNHSRSSRNVLRGLHYQVVKPQGKLVRVVNGSILDVAVDLRKSSRTFGTWVAEVLSAENHKQLWVPPGFAHGFLVLSETADVLYKTTEFWHKEHDRSLRWDDPTINVDWNLTESPLLSEKDFAAPLLKDSEVFF